MKVPIYILGILNKYGPQHGYQIKKIFSEQIAHFIQVKLPLVYYHLEKMKCKGLLSSEIGTGRGVEKTIYSITSKGKTQFTNQLKEACGFRFRPEFLNDAIFYFNNFIEPDLMRKSIDEYITQIESALLSIENQQSIVNNKLNKKAKKMSEFIFEHHIVHYEAELNWIKSIQEKLYK